jgi:hypothetical protein
MAVIRKIAIHSVGGDGVHIPLPPVSRQTREHILLARQVSIVQTGGSAIDAGDAAAELHDVTIDDTGADGAILANGAVLDNVEIRGSAGDNLVVGDDARLRDVRLSGAGGANMTGGHKDWIELLSASGGLTGALVLGDDARLSNVDLDSSGGNALLTGQRLHLRGSRLRGSVATGADADVQHNSFDLDIDSAESASFSNGGHELGHNVSHFHGTNTANLPALAVFGEASAIHHNTFIVADPPAGPPTTRNPPAFVKYDGIDGEVTDNKMHGIHPGTEGLSIIGDNCTITGNVVGGAVPATPGSAAIGIIFTGNNSLIARNTFTGLGPAGTPILATGTGNALAPIVTPATLSTNCSPDRNLHVPD